MAPNDKAGRVVFIGNIPYGITEEQIVKILERVGTVINFRLVYDKETGRPKGFGFAEFLEADAAASAVRNLNDYEIMGRKLRVDWSNDNGAGENAPNVSVAPATAPPNGQPVPIPTQQPGALPPLPPGAPPANDGLNAPDAISRTLSTLPPEQLLDILSQMKGLVMTDPAKASELLRKAPQLAYALFQSLLLLNLVDATMLSQVIEPAAAAAAPPTAAPQQPPPAAQPPRGYPGYPQQAAPTPPVQAQPPPQPYGNPLLAQYPQLAQYPSEVQQQYAQILALTPDQIVTLPPDHRNTIMQIRQSLGVR